MIYSWISYRTCFPIYLEPRTATYLKEPYFEFLNAHGIYHVFSQKIRLPNIYDLYEEFKHLIRDRVIIRLMGDERGAIEEMAQDQWDRILLPKDNEIRGIVGMLRDLDERGIHTNVNTHFEGSSPLTVRRIETMLGVR